MIVWKRTRQSITIWERERAQILPCSAREWGTHNTTVFGQREKRNADEFLHAVTRRLHAGAFLQNTWTNMVLAHCGPHTGPPYTRLHAGYTQGRSLFCFWFGFGGGGVNNCCFSLGWAVVGREDATRKVWNDVRTSVHQIPEAKDIGWSTTFQPMCTLQGEQ